MLRPYDSESLRLCNLQGNKINKFLIWWWCFFHVCIVSYVRPWTHHSFFVTDLSSLRMTDRNATVLCLLCHYLKLLQACRLPSVANWSSEFLKLVLDRIREFQQVGGKTRILFYSNLDSSIAGWHRSWCITICNILYSIDSFLFTPFVAWTWGAPKLLCLLYQSELPCNPNVVAWKFVLICLKVCRLLYDVDRVVHSSGHQVTFNVGPNPDEFAGFGNPSLLCPHAALSSDFLWS